MRWLRRVALAILGIVVVALIGAYLLLRGSLPQLDGKASIAALAAPVAIERDVLGVVTIAATNRVDLAYATGYAHAQDRFFQMDLQRRVAAGELAALLGKDFVALDKQFRRHGFRKVAATILTQATPEQRQLLEAYVAGVNAACDAMTVRPFEYLLLGTEPAPWQLQDSILVAFAMYIDLNDSNGTRELERARLHAALPQSVFDFLYPRGGLWDAPLDAEDLASLRAPIPTADVIDVRKQQSTPSATTASADADYPGSNNWAVAGTRTANGRALVANDMHLRLRLAHIWYRARLVVKSEDANVARDLAGVTLPGLPILVAGSNGHIAWGFTNTHGDFDDLVVVEPDPQQASRYRVGDAFSEYSVRRERIEVRDGEAVEVAYRDTQWGPLLDADLDGKPLALARTAHRPEATNLRQLDLETASSVAQALIVANESGIPAQNFVVADRDGHIAWTIIGKLPRRSGFDGRLPTCWGCAASLGWDGWLAPQEYPRVIDPANGQLWSANSRTLAGPGARAIGDEDMDRGARTKQIRDHLLSLKQPTVQDMLAVQLDDRAVFLKRWRDALLRLLDESYVRDHPTRRAAQALALNWSGKAAVDDAGYRVVRAFRAAVQEDIYRGLTALARARYPNAEFKPTARFEDSLWQIITSHPEHLLNPESENWDAQLLASLDRALGKLKDECNSSDRSLRECTWGKRNTLAMEHPLASALPVVGLLLRMAPAQLPGDGDMPRVQSVSFGASERFAVSPGREAEGYFHMPGGQSGHPLSPYFKAGHEAWVKGEPTPFLPGQALHRLELSPLR